MARSTTKAPKVVNCADCGLARWSDQPCVRCTAKKTQVPAPWYTQDRADLA